MVKQSTQNKNFGFGLHLKFDFYEFNLLKEVKFEVAVISGKKAE
jgi:hypothetical protein